MSRDSDLEKETGYAFRDAHLLDMALTHASASRAGGADYERLEFLGDRVAGLVIADMLYKAFPSEVEGLLARRHAAMVQKAAMAEVADACGIGVHIRLSPGETREGGVRNRTILSDAVEALIGAIYLDGGFAAAERFVRKYWTGMLNVQEDPPQDPKTALQEWTQARGLPLPEYILVSKTGADHAPVFEIALHVETMPGVSATAASKRTAEKDAAQTMLEMIEREEESRSGAARSAQ